RTNAYAACALQHGPSPFGTVTNVIVRRHYNNVRCRGNPSSVCAGLSSSRAVGPRAGAVIRVLLREPRGPSREEAGQTSQWNVIARSSKPAKSPLKCGRRAIEQDGLGLQIGPQPFLAAFAAHAALLEAAERHAELHPHPVLPHDASADAAADGIGG